MKKNLFREFIENLKSEGELTEINTPCSPELEIGEITDRIAKQPGGGKALLFTNNGTAFPLLINGYGSTSRMLKALHLKDYDEFGERIDSLFSLLQNPPKGLGGKLKTLGQLRKLSSFFPKKITGHGACQEVIHSEPDLSILPVLKCWPHDAGRFITLPMVHTKDPVTGQLNVGMYRMQVMGKNTTGMHWHMHKTGARHYDAYKEAGKRIPVAVALGGDPVYAWCASAPLPDGINEYILAGFLRQKAVRMVPCLTQEMDVPEDADIIIEGYVDPSEPLVSEGPFGDHTGFYSLQDKYPLFHVTCITHRRDAIYPATIVGIPPQEDYYMIEGSEKLFLPLMQKAQLPEVTDMHMPACGVAHNLVIVSIRNQFPGHAQKVIHSLWGAGQMMFNKVLIVVDHDVPLRNYPALLNAIASNVRPSTDIFLSGGASDVLDHAADHFAYTGKMGIDATRKKGKPFSGPIINPLLLPSDMDADTGPDGANLPLLMVKIRSGANPDEMTGRIAPAINGEALLILCDFDYRRLGYEYTLWYILANTDPSRDVKKYTAKNQSLWVINACSRKIKTDGSPWPEIAVSDSKTIEMVDKKWKEYMLGEMPESPSTKFYKLSGPSAFKS